MSKSKPQVNPMVERLHEKNCTPRLALRGYVGPSPDGRIRIHPDFCLDTYIELPDEAILEFDEDSEDGDVLLFIDPSANMKVVSSKTVSVMAMMDDGNDDSQAEINACVTKAIDKCIDDAMIDRGLSRGRATRACEKTRSIRKIFCKIGPILGGSSLT